MILVKIGGSVLTDKRRYLALREEALVRLARELASTPRALVLVHGAGSFGHVVARDHALAAGRRGESAQDHAAAKVHQDVRALHLAVLGALTEAGRPAVGVSPFDVALLDGGELARFDAGPVSRALACGLVPVTHGDLVPDEARGWGILSGDAILEALAHALKPERVLVVTDVDGLHDRPPSEPGAALLARVTADEAVRALAGASTGVDVTGGMAGKVARLAAIARAGVPVTLVNGLAKGRVADALAGRDVPRTDVVPS